MMPSKWTIEDKLELDFYFSIMFFVLFGIGSTIALALNSGRALASALIALLGSLICLHGGSVRQDVIRVRDELVRKGQE